MISKKRSGGNTIDRKIKIKNGNEYIRLHLIRASSCLCTEKNIAML